MRQYASTTSRTSPVSSPSSDITALRSGRRRLAKDSRSGSAGVVEQPASRSPDEVAQSGKTGLPRRLALITRITGYSVHASRLKVLHCSLDCRRQFYRCIRIASALSSCALYAISADALRSGRLRRRHRRIRARDLRLFSTPYPVDNGLTGYSKPISQRLGIAVDCALPAQLHASAIVSYVRPQSGAVRPHQAAARGKAATAKPISHRAGRSADDIGGSPHRALSVRSRYSTWGSGNAFFYNSSAISRVLRAWSSRRQSSVARR